MNWERTIFLAHASEDKELVRDLYQKLKDYGLSPWLDEKDIAPGEEWDKKIKEAIRKSRFFLACLSGRSVTKKGYVQRELRIALSMAEEKPHDAIYLIPGLLEDVEIPDITVGTIHLKSYQYVRLYDSNGFHRLVQRLKNEMGLSQEVISLEAREALKEVGLGFLDKVDQFNNEIDALTVLAVKSFKEGDFDQAHEHLQTALKIDQNRVSTLLNLGRLYKIQSWTGNDANRAFEMFQRATDKGSIEAKTELGVCYQEGYGVSQNYNKSYELFREAADSGYAPAIALLGLAYLGGQGVEKDTHRGLDLITKAAELGDSEAQSSLSEIYDVGIFGVAPDKKKAVEWAIKAAYQGDEAAINHIKEYVQDAHFRLRDKK